MKAEISLSFPSSIEAERVLSVINPDNYPLPEGLEIGCSIKDTNLVIFIHCTRSISSFSSTIEDILSAIDLSLRTSESLDTT